MSGDANGGMSGGRRGRWLLAGPALASPPALTYLCLQLALLIDRLYLGPPWQLIVVYLVGPGALTCGLFGALAAGHVVSPGSRLGRVAVIVSEMALSLYVLVLVDPVKGWK